MPLREFFEDHRVNGLRRISRPAVGQNPHDIEYLQAVEQVLETKP